MRARLFHKMFIAIALASMASIVLFAGSTHWYMNRSFLRYLNDTHAQHLNELAENLARYYTTHGDWRTLGDNRRTFRRLIQDSAPASPMALEPRPAPSGERPHFRFDRHRGFKPHFAVYDASRHLVAGNTPASEVANIVPVQVDGATVGWVGMAPVRRFVAAPETRFARRQYQVLLFAAVVVCCLSLIAAYVTARRLAAPVRLLRDATGQLAGGNFETRLPPLGHDEIGELAQDVNVLARSLQHHESARRRWFADVSHELRTPLAIIRGELDAVIDGIRPNDEHTIASLNQETARLQKLVEGLYDLARADIGTLDYEFVRCSPATVLMQSILRFRPRFESAGLTIEQTIDQNIELLADPDRLTQLFDNLLENCCRYVAQGGHVRITLTRREKVAEVRFDDSGPGVPAAVMPHIFEPLTRGEDSRNRAFGGSGLGLALCHRIAIAHGGTIRALPSPAGGLAIAIELPLDGPA